MISEAYERASQAMEDALAALDPDLESTEECECERLALYGRELCRQCLDGPDDSDLDLESIGGFTYDIQVIKDTEEGT